MCGGKSLRNNSLAFLPTMTTGQVCTLVENCCGFIGRTGLEFDIKCFAVMTFGTCNWLGRWGVMRREGRGGKVGDELGCGWYSGLGWDTFQLWFDVWRGLGIGNYTSTNIIITWGTGFEGKNHLVMIMRCRWKSLTFTYSIGSHIEFPFSLWLNTKLLIK